MTPKANVLETYLTEIAHTRATGAGVEETSYYGALANALNEIGRGLRPKVQCVLQLANHGAGLPDGGLFTAEQCRTPDLTKPLLGQVPARGVIEVKGPGFDLDKLIQSKQISDYWAAYRLVLATNLRAWALVGEGPDGKPKVLERFVLAEDETSFWRLAEHPRTAQEKLGAPFAEYLRQVQLHNAPLAAPRDVAAILASYARTALSRVENADTPALTSLRTALSEALGLRFEGEKGEHFFRSTLVQTLFYGLFAAWVLWSRSGRRGADAPFPQQIRDSASPLGSRPDRFDWHAAGWSLRLPVIRVLFEQVATPSKLGPLGLVEVLDWAAAALGRVDEEAFFKSFDEGHAVQYFYEPFLEEFDPALRKDLGVWYTPEEIVAYQVARVDAVLREELDIPDGLADPNVYVLDPCCGTGAYLRFVLAKIEETLRAKGGDALVANDLKRAAMDRVFGFEILPAPFVIAHLQLGLLLHKAGAPLSEAKSERVGVYLTNALVGWEPPTGPKQTLMWPEMEEERNAADRVKRDAPILVVLGNPPYNAFAGTSPVEEKGLVEPYKAGLVKDWGIKKFNLDDLYVRFFRIAEKRIAEGTGRGVVSFISNHSWVSEPSFVVLRKRLLGSFDDFWIENMHGNRKISEYSPDGRTSETVFAIPGFSSGIQQGVAISLWVKSGRRAGNPCVRVRDDLHEARAAERRDQLLRSLEDPEAESHYILAAPTKDNRYSFRPGTVNLAYQSWPRVIDLCSAAPSNGLMEKRGGALFDFDREALRRRMQRYFDANVSWTMLKSEGHPLTADAARYPAEATRLKVLAAEPFSEARIRRYALRPYESQWCYYSGIRPLWNEPRPRLWSLHERGSPFLVTRLRPAKAVEGPPISYSTGLFDDHFLAPDAVGIPLPAKLPERTGELFSEPVAGDGLSPLAAGYLRRMGREDTIAPDVSLMLWMHALAVAHSPGYLAQNSDALRQDWPRIPLPAKRDVLLASAELGKRISALLDIDSPVPGVTGGTIEPAYRDFGGIHRTDGKSLDLEAGDLEVTAGWGHAGKAGVVMPGRGKTTDHGNTLDIWLNDRVYWRNVPRPVWEYTIGGYQVVKKWLSYREKALLGRPLTPEEARYVTEMVRRLAALIAMQPALDANYEAVRADTATLSSPA
jgi:hypothetical protein